MIKQITKKKARKSKFKVVNMVSRKIYRVGKTTLLHLNLLFGKITAFQNTFAKVVTQFGIISTLISSNRLNSSAATDVTLDYTKELSFSAACKKSSLC